TGAGAAADLRQLAERDEFARGCSDQHFAQSLKVVAFVAGQAHLDGKPRAAFDGRGQVAATETRFDDIEQILRADAESSHRHAVHFDFEIRLALDAAWRDPGRAGHAAHNALDLERLLLQRVKVVTENLHAELRADSCTQHQ